MPPIKLELPMLDDRPGPAAHIAAERAQRIVDQAVDQGLPRAGSPRGRTYAKWPVLLAAAVVVAAAAASVTSAVRRHATPAPSEAPIAESPATAAGPIVAAPSATPDPPVRDTAAAPREAKSSPPGSRELTPSPPARSLPDDLLRQANDLRAARRWRDAARVYERVLAVHPASPEAYAAAVAAADLHLEQMSDPRGALRLYRAALQRSAQGPLSEQALWGAARCEASLGDADAERRALQDYVTRYPNGLFAGPAQKRLRELSSAAP